MLRQLTIIDLKDNKKRNIGVHPIDIKFVEEVSPTKCNIVIMIQGKEYIYLCLASFKYLYNLSNYSQFNIFKDN